MNDPIPLDESQENEPMLAPGVPDEREPMFPEVTMSHPDLAKFPNKGKAVIEHEVIRRTHEKINGKHHHRVTVKIKSIRPMGRKISNRPHSAESAMRGLMDQDQDEQ